VPGDSGVFTASESIQLVHLETGSPDLEIFLGVARTSDDEPLITYQGPGLSSPEYHNTIIEPDTWYHYAWTLESGTLVEAYIDGADGSAPTLTSSLPSISTIEFGYDSALSQYYEVYFDEIRISDGIVRYPEPGITRYEPWVSDEYTTMLIHGDDTIEDDNLVRTGTEDYFYRQNGGSAVVEAKNPLALKVVDYNGDAWDGAVDLHLRGLPKVAKIGNQLAIKYDN